MTASTVTAREALQRLLDASKLIDFADCKDERVWQALGAAQGTAEGVLRDWKPELSGMIADFKNLLANLRHRQTNGFGPKADGYAYAEIADWMLRGHLSVLESFAPPVAAQLAVVAAQWLPTSENINALPDGVRHYVHDLIARCDPSGDVAATTLMRDACDGLQRMYRKAADTLTWVVGCFSAAEAEGLQDALAETTDERLKDLIERRLMYAYAAAQGAAAPAIAAPIELIDTPEFMDLLNKFAHESSCEEFNQEAYTAARVAIVNHIAAITTGETIERKEHDPD